MATETYSSSGYTFQWKGGEYIDVFMDGGEYPLDCINVWDYGLSEATITSRVSFIQECEDWLDDNEEDSVSYDADSGFFDGFDFDDSDPYEKEYDLA